MKKFNKKSLALLISITLLLTFTVSGTVAFLVDGSGSVVNTFTPGTVDTTIDEITEGNVKQAIEIKNVGTVDVYVRVALIANYLDSNGNIVNPATISDFQPPASWIQIGDYYYYTKLLKPNETTDDLLTNSITLGEDAYGNDMQIVVIHQSIQAQPDTTVESVWPVIVNDGDQTISAAT